MVMIKIAVCDLPLSFNMKTRMITTTMIIATKPAISSTYFSILDALVAEM